MKITELKYSNTNTFIIEGERGCLLFDTGWAGAFPQFCKILKKQGYTVSDIDYILISHYHPDHCGIAQEIAENGPVILVMDVQKDHIHYSDRIFEKEKNPDYRPVDDSSARYLAVKDSRSFLSELGINGEILHTPGHSDDSISLWLDEGVLFVGDLNPLYELELHEGSMIHESWEKLMALDPEVVYYGHAKAAQLKQTSKEAEQETDGDKEELVRQIVRMIDKGYTLDKIRKKTGADAVFTEDVARMYLTHPGVSIQGILDRIEIKGR